MSPMMIRPKPMNGRRTSTISGVGGAGKSTPKAPMTSSHSSAVIGENMCSYANRSCTQQRLDGYVYCIRHILEDKSAPYKRCSYICDKNNKQCFNAAHKTTKDKSFCVEHAAQAVHLQLKALRGGDKPRTKKYLLNQLQHYDSMTSSSSSSQSNPGNTVKTAPVATTSSALIDYDSDTCREEPISLDETWKDIYSDDESLDSDQEDILKHAGSYTAEEVAYITREKLIKLQSLYIEQFRYLQHRLKEERRKFLKNRDWEEETFGRAIPEPQTLVERKHLLQLQALRRYRRRHGPEAVLRDQSRERRLMYSDVTGFRSQSSQKCIASVRTGKCYEPVMPLSKYCPQHVLTDPHQVLFKACSEVQKQCKQPLPNYRKTHLCSLHLPLSSQFLTKLSSNITSTEADLLTPVAMETDDLPTPVTMETEQQKPSPALTPVPIDPPKSTEG